MNVSITNRFLGKKRVNISSRSRLNDLFSIVRFLPNRRLTSTRALVSFNLDKVQLLSTYEVRVAFNKRLFASQIRFRCEKIVPCVKKATLFFKC